MHATLPFHHPHHIRERGDQLDPDDLRRILHLLLAGLAAGVL